MENYLRSSQVTSKGRAVCGDKPQARFGEGGTGDPATGDRPLLYKVNAQLACRSIDVHFKRYDATKKVECTTFQSVLWALQRQLPVECEPPLLQKHWEFLYARSLGCVGLLKQHLNEALRLALDENAQTVTLDHLRRTVLHKEKVDLALEAILKGEQDLAEAEDADQDLLIKLGMIPAGSQLTPQEAMRNKKYGLALGARKNGNRANEDRAVTQSDHSLESRQVVRRIRR